ncbi:MAG: hypothetical protein PHS57_02050 [Alphaproteobacteria bacterium]|nr:hypothetical protein [Alphaproteobacteria bacterium]
MSTITREHNPTKEELKFYFEEAFQIGGDILGTLNRFGIQPLSDIPLYTKRIQPEYPQGCFNGGIALLVRDDGIPVKIFTALGALPLTNALAISVPAKTRKERFSFQGLTDDMAAITQKKAAAFEALKATLELGKAIPLPSDTPFLSKGYALYSIGKNPVTGTALPTYDYSESSYGNLPYGEIIALWDKVKPSNAEHNQTRLDAIRANVRGEAPTEPAGHVATKIRPAATPS